jgi:hypothetical protein
MKGDHVNVRELSTNHMAVGSLQGKTGTLDLYTIPLYTIPLYTIPLYTIPLYTIPLFAQVRLPRKILYRWLCSSRSVGD